MATRAQDIVGLEAFTREGDSVGRVKKWISCRGSDLKFVVIRIGTRSTAARDDGPGIARILRSGWTLPRLRRRQEVVVPAEAVRERGHKVVVPFSNSCLERAPRVSTSGSLSRGERARLESYYREAV
jgi:hypothetical protein